MKNKILEILKDYKNDFYKYIKIYKRKFKKLYRKTTYVLKKIKEKILIKENRKKYLTITSIVILINLLIINLYVSFGYYNNQASFKLINAVVGNIYLDEYDYVLLVYLENVDSEGNGNGKYRLSDSIPLLGYNYSGYMCQNNSVLIYDDSTKTTSVTTIQKDVCSIYFDTIDIMDLTVTIMLEDSFGSNTYSISEQIPAFGYKYSSYECTNNGVLDYNSNLHSVKLSTSTAEHCKVYFTKQSSDISINLYVEKTYQTKDYVTRTSIPSNNNYILNNINSFCINGDNERVDSSITYEEGYINIEASEKVTCDIYLDKENE